MNKKMYHRKLVRDKIPNRIEKNGGTYEVIELRGSDLHTKVLDKIVEEARELHTATDRTHTISELADLFEIIEKFMELEDISNEEVDATRRKKLETHGKFDLDLELIWTQDEP